jgi:hypothetical protein
MLNSCLMVDSVPLKASCSEIFLTCCPSSQTRRPSSRLDMKVSPLKMSPLNQILFFRLICYVLLFIIANIHWSATINHSRFDGYQTQILDLLGNVKINYNSASFEGGCIASTFPWMHSIRILTVLFNQQSIPICCIRGDYK